MPNFSGTNAAESVKSLKGTLHICCFCNTCCPLVASSGRARLRRPAVVEGVDRRQAALAPGPKNAMGRSTPSTEGNGLLAGAIVRPAHPVGAPLQAVMGGGKHLQTGPLQTSLWLETSTTGKSAALCSLAALFSWRVSGEFTSNIPLILVSNFSLFCRLKDTKSQFSQFCSIGSDIKNGASLFLLLVKSLEMFQGSNIKL